jgi:integrase
LHRDPRKRSPFWFGAYTDKDGVRHFKSTKQSIKAKAQLVLDGWIKGVRLARNNALTEIAARNVIAEIYENAHGEPLQFYTTRVWLMEWLGGKEDAKAINTHSRYKSVIDGFLEDMGAKADKNIALVTPKDIRAFRSHEAVSGKSPQTCNFAIKVLSAAFHSAQRQGYITSNPCNALDGLKPTRNEKAMFTKEQVEAVYGVASQPWKTAILLGYYTGARLQDVCNLTWENVDFQRGAIVFISRKTGGVSVVGLSPVLEEHLLSMNVSDKPDSFIIPALAGKKSQGKTGLSQQFAKLLTKAGIDRGAIKPDKEDGKGRTFNAYSFHSLRHTFNSTLANSGVSQELRMKMTGHASTDINDLYTHHSPESLRKAVESMPRLNVAVNPEGVE